MQLRRLLGLSGHLRRSLCSAATPPRDSGQWHGWSWYMLGKMMAGVGSSPRPYVVIGNPPRVSDLYMPEHLAKTRGLSDPDPDSDVVRVSFGQACSASVDGLLLLHSYDIRATTSLLAKQGDNKVRQLTGLADPDRLPGMAHFVFNPVTGQLFRLPAIQGPKPKKSLVGFNLGILTHTKADAGRGPPDRYAVAELDGNADVMLRFLSETGDWDLVKCSPCPLPAAERRMVISQEALPFKGHLWWVDLTWGAICADPFRDRPEPRFIELPSGSVLPAEAEAIRPRSLLPDADGNVWWMKAPAMYRRVGVTRDCLRYVEVSEEEPFVLSSFLLDADGRGWTLNHRVPLTMLWAADGGYPWLPLQGKITRPKIGVLDLGNINVVHLIVGHHIVVVDMHKGEVVTHCPREGDIKILPCYLSPWLPTSPIPSAGMYKDASGEVRQDASSAMPKPPYPYRLK